MAKIINKEKFSEMIRERKYTYLMLSPFLISENHEIYGKCDDLDYGSRVLKILDDIDRVEILILHDVSPEWQQVLGTCDYDECPVFRVYQESGVYSEFILDQSELVHLPFGN